MHTPAVSIVIPTYNRADTVEAAIKSVLDQSFDDFELLIVDDCSRDNTVEIVRGIDDPRITVIEQETNGGAGAARNTGINAARAKWVAFHDSDDIWLPGKLEKQMQRLADMPDAVACYCGMWVEGRTPEPDADPDQPLYIPRRYITTREGDIMPWLRTRSFISTQTLIASRDHLQAIGGFDADIPALIDWEMMLRLAPRGDVLIVDEPLVRQRFSENSITKSSRNRTRARLHVLGRHKAMLSQFPDDLAFHHYEISGGLRQLGHYKQAHNHAVQAASIKPENKKYQKIKWALSVMKYLPTDKGVLG